MPRRRDPDFITGHLCRFCGKLVPWGTILRLIRVDPEPPAQDCRGQSEHAAQGYMVNETACHTECLRKKLRPGVELTFHRHWNGRAPMLDDDADIYLPLSPRGEDAAQRPVRGTGRPPHGEGAKPKIQPCAMCGRDIAPADLVRLRVQKPVGPVKQPQFDEQTLPLHFECLAAVSASRLS